MYCIKKMFYCLCNFKHCFLMLCIQLYQFICNPNTQHSTLSHQIPFSDNSSKICPLEVKDSSQRSRWGFLWWWLEFLVVFSLSGGASHQWIMTGSSSAARNLHMNQRSSGHQILNNSRENVSLCHVASSYRNHLISQFQK